jgi:hypothetical protein
MIAANYMIVCKESKSENKYYEKRFRRAIRHGKFIEKHGTAKSVCVISLRKPGKVAFYSVAGHPEKREEAPRAKDLK